MGFFHLNEGDVGKLKKKEDINGLIKALKYKDDSFVRFKAAEALGELEDKAAVDALISALNDEDMYVREMVIYALGEIGDKRAVLPLISNFGYDDELREIMIFALGEIGGKQSVDYLKLSLGDDDVDIGVRSAEALGKISDPDSIEALIESAKSDNIELKIYSITALGEIGDEKAIKNLLKTAQSNKWNVRRYSLHALGKIEECSILPFINALDDEDCHVREKAVELIGKWGDDNSLQYLKKVLNDPDPDVRKRATLILEKHQINSIKMQRPKIKNKKLQSRLDNIIERIGKDEAVEILIEFLNDKNPGMRHTAAELLGEIGDKKAIVPLINVLRDDSSSVQWSAKEALIKLGKPSVKPLIKVLDYNDSKVRMNAIDVLGDIGDNQAIPSLFKYLGDDNATVRQKTEISLIKFGFKAVNFLIIALEDEKFIVRQKAAETLGEIGDQAALDPLNKVLNDENPHVRNSAQEAIKMIKKKNALMY